MHGVHDACNEKYTYSTIILLSDIYCNRESLINYHTICLQVIQKSENILCFAQCFHKMLLLTEFTRKENSKTAHGAKEGKNELRVVG